VVILLSELGKKGDGRTKLKEVVNLSCGTGTSGTRNGQHSKRATQTAKGGDWSGKA